LIYNDNKDFFDYEITDSGVCSRSDGSLAVGGKNLLYDLPLTIAEQLGYFQAEGLK